MPPRTRTHHSLADRATGDSAAGHARSVLARATSARITWLGPDASQPHDVASVVIDRPGAPTPAHRRPAVVEITDVAPLPVRNRVRARVRLHGYAEYAAPASGAEAAEPARIAVRTVEVETGGRTHLLRPEQLRAATPDPFARREAAFLSHLTTAHGDLVHALGRLASRDEPAERVVPLALGREGFTFRLEQAGRERDVLLAFPSPAETPDDVRRSMIALAEQATAGDHGRESRRQRLLPALFRSGPAAARICRPDSP